MATIIVKNPGTKPFGGTPYGNTQNRHFILETNAAGAVVGSNSAVALGIGDKVVLGGLDRGMRIDDALAIVATALTAATTGKLGFEYSDGVDDTQAQATKEGRPYVPQDDDYFFAALASNAQGRTRANNVAVEPVTLPKHANLIWTHAGAANAKVGKVHFLVYGEDRGPL